MLRVRLDACELADGLVFFKRIPLTGVGVEVAGPDHRSPGRAWLWEYQDGARVGRWVEPDFRGDQSVMFDWRVLDDLAGLTSEQFRNADFLCLDDQQFTGTLVDTDETYLLGIQADSESKLARWSTDGHLIDYRDRQFVPWGTQLLSVCEEVSFFRGVETLRLFLSSPFPASLSMDFDEQGRIRSILVSGPFFESATQAVTNAELRGGHVLSLGELTGRQVAHKLNLGTPSEVLPQVLDALGDDALAQVRDLRFHANEWGPDLIAQVTSLPSLETIDVIGASNIDPRTAEVFTYLEQRVSDADDLLRFFQVNGTLPGQWRTNV